MNLPLLAYGVISIKFPDYEFRSIEKYYIEGFRNPVPGFEWLPVPSFDQYRNLELIIILLAFLFVLGLFTRFVGPFMVILYTYLFLISQYNYHHHVMNFVIVFWILAFSNCYEHYSLDSYIRGGNYQRTKGPVLPNRLLQVFISIVYLFSFIQKLNHGWLTGEITLIYYNQGTIRGDLVDYMTMLLSSDLLSQYAETFWRGFGLMSVIIEGFLAFALWVPGLRRFAIVTGFLFHLGIYLTVNVQSFSFQMWALYIAFLTPESKQNIIYFDGNNERISMFVRICSLFDWFKRVNWIDYRSIEIMEGREYMSTHHIFAMKPDNMALKGFSLYIFLFGLFPLTFVISFIIGIFYSTYKYVRRLWID